MAEVPGTPPLVGLPGISFSRNESSTQMYNVGLANVEPAGAGSVPAVPAAAAAAAVVVLVKPPLVTLSNCERPLSLGGALAGSWPVSGVPAVVSGAFGSPLGTALERSMNPGAVSAV